MAGPRRLVGADPDRPVRRRPCRGSADRRGGPSNLNRPIHASPSDRGRSGRKLTCASYTDGGTMTRSHTGNTGGGVETGRRGTRGATRAKTGRPPMTHTPDHATDDRRALGQTEGPMEDALEESFTRQVLEGTQRLSRPWWESSSPDSSVAPKWPSVFSPYS